MANKIFIEYWSIKNAASDNKSEVELSSEKETIECSLTQDINIQAQSEFTRFGEVIPSFMSSVLDTMKVISSANGSIGTSLADLINKLDAPFWSGTPPVKVTTQLAFFTKTDSYKDVVKPTVDIVGLTILTRDPKTNKFIIPGINLKNLSKFSSDARENLSSDSKLISMEIPGIVYLPICLIESAVPTFSNEITESSYPLWSIIDITFMGVTPANIDMFDSAKESQRRQNCEEKYGREKIKSAST